MTIAPRAFLDIRLRRSFAALDEKIKIDDVLLYRAEGEQEDRLCPRTGDQFLAKYLLEPLDFLPDMVRKDCGHGHKSALGHSLDLEPLGRDVPR
jgi:hypothetical protein